MKKRQYDQYCPVACALDIVGERWAMLVVRELLVGPKRFVDLETGLPGIGTNTLTTRLDELEAAGVIAKRRLPPPAAATVYELTPWGRELEPIVHAIAVWPRRASALPRRVTPCAQPGSPSRCRRSFAVMPSATSPRASSWSCRQGPSP